MDIRFHVGSMFWALLKILIIQDPCRLGSPEILTVAQMSQGSFYGLVRVPVSVSFYDINVAARSIHYGSYILAKLCS